MKIVSNITFVILILLEVTILISSTPLSEFKNNGLHRSKKSVDNVISEKFSARSENVDDFRDVLGERQKRLVATGLSYLYENKLKKLEWPKKVICFFTNCSPTPPRLPPTMHISGSTHNVIPPPPAPTNVIVVENAHHHHETNVEPMETVPELETTHIIHFEHSSSDNNAHWSPNTNHIDRKRRKRCIACALFGDATRLMWKVANIPAQVLHFPQRMLNYQDKLEAVKHVYPQVYNPYQTYPQFK